MRFQLACIGLVCMTCLLIGASPVQSGTPLKFGLKGGAVLSDQDYDLGTRGEPNPEARTGFVIGAFTRLSLARVVSLQPEVQFLKKGVEMITTSASSPDPIRSRDRFDILSLSVLLNAHLPKAIGPYLLAGPRLDIKMSDDLEILDSNDWKTAIFGGTFGAGYEVNLPSAPALLAEIQFQLDFTKAFDGDNLGVTNRAWVLMVGVRF